MLITAELLDIKAPQADIDRQANALLVGMSKFSTISCSDGRFYGVTTPCDTCGDEFNECIRRKLVSAVFSAQAVTEKNLKYDLTPRYHTETQSWDGHSRLITLRPGIQSFGVREKINSVSGTTLYPVSPYIIEEAPIVDSEAGYCIVQLDREIVENPNSVILRTESGAKTEPEPRFGFPRRTATDWEFALSSQYSSPCTSGTINVQHCRYVAVEAEKKTVLSGEVVPVYPGTNQKIPLARPTQDVDENTVRYWFYVWDLLDPSFFSEGMAWEEGEFYKLIENIELKNFTEEAAPITVKYRDTCCKDEERFGTLTFEDYRVIDARLGVVELFRDAEPCSICDCAEECEAIVEVTYSYKTDPSFFILDFGEALAKGIAYLIAAELPLKVCQCNELKTGFIKTAQEPYSKIVTNLYTGLQTENHEHGGLYGQAVYDEELERATFYRKVLRL